ncbi:uncharacterized protein LOC124870470 isoform X3 [Girardinichthys multiradiatus]|uniref:uncharacterized protein LOC124870470 isoform X3 n=1 Tax=Girardinichthys multiradiatus TaxID=208333 RepID=UPI001FAC323B|nr:uncharacterized protein LOC124870470 isoform X3 [Girardinichthys multiradiatus]
MEACMMKPEAKKKPTPIKRNEAEREVRPTPLMPPRPTDAELTHTQYRMERSAASHNEQNDNIQQGHTNLKPSETPVAPSRLTEKDPKAATRHSKLRENSRETEQPEAAADETDFKRSSQSGLMGMLRLSQKEKMPAFTSYLTDIFDQEEQTDDVPIRQASSNKPASKERSPDPSAEKTSSEKEQLGETNKEQHNAEHKRDEGSLLKTGMFWKTPKERSSSPAVKVSKADSDSEDVEKKEEKTSEPTHEKGGFCSGILKMSNKPADETFTQEKGGIFSGIFRKSPKPAETDRDKDVLQSDLSANSENLPENTNVKEKGNMFSGMFRRSPKPSEGSQLEEENLAADRDDSGSSDSLSETGSRKGKKIQDDEMSSSEGPNDNSTKEKGQISGGMLQKTPKSRGAAQSEEVAASDPDASASTENVSDNTQDRETQRELLDSSEDRAENNKETNIFSNMFKKTQKPAAEGSKTEMDRDPESQLWASSENLTDTTSPKKKKGLAEKFKRWSSFDNLFDEDKNIFSSTFKRTPKPADEGSPATGSTLFGSSEYLLEPKATKEKTGGLAGIFKMSPKPSPRSVVTQDPLSDSKELSASWDSLTEAGKFVSASIDNLSDNSSSTKEKRVGFSGMLRRTPKHLEQQEGEDTPPPTGRGLSSKRTIKKKRSVVSFRVKKTLPKTSKERSSKMLLIEESVEMEDLNTLEESTVLVEPVEMVAYQTEENPAQAEQENNELMEWWNSVKGWTEWNESSDFQEEGEQMAMEQAADRVYMAARLFVYLFNQRGASLQQRILELLSVADAADEFHKKTVSAAVGGGVASVAGSVATITGLILAPFTFGASIIVTAVGISVATAGSITSATANITDTVHSNMDRKKVEKMIQGYQEEIQDIRKCMEFVQEGMDTLQEWDFEKYSQSAAKKALSHNIKHVMKEGGRAGKALMINTDKLISTVQVLGAAGGAAKAAQAISITTGVMSALFLALDVFFLAKDSHELRKGAKTKFAGKIRQVCKDLQDGLLELNKVKTQLQKTMDGIEVEEYEEIQEVEVEVEDELESDPKKLAELEQEIDFLEEKLDKKEDKKEDLELKKSKETLLDIFKIKEKKDEKSIKEKGEVEEKEEKDKGEKMSESKSEKKKVNEMSVKTVKEVLKEQFEKGSKKE